MLIFNRISELHLTVLQAEAAVDHLHKANILHRDIKPANFLMHEGRLLLNDFDVSCFIRDREARKQHPVGTVSFWSPSCDVHIKDWLYDKDDDWMGLALTFASWLGVYQDTSDRDACARSVNKVCVVKELLRAGYGLPESFKTRMEPVYKRVSHKVKAQWPAPAPA